MLFSTIDSGDLYLRLSVTDHCNLYCRYCRSAAPKNQQSTFGLDEEKLLDLVLRIERLSPLKKLRLTGGEPLIKRQLPNFIAKLRQRLPNTELCLTTNGILLKQQASLLKQTGLDRINISLDTLNEKSFIALTRCGSVKEVIEGIEAAEEAGFKRIKINTVLLRSYNSKNLPDLVRFAFKKDCQIRFIELMPMEMEHNFYEQEYFSAQEALLILSETFTYRHPLENKGKTSYHLFQDQGKKLSVGFIPSVSQPFCSSCNKLRIDCRGNIFPCLRSSQGLSYSSILHTESDDKLQKMIQEITGKIKENEEHREFYWHRRSMAAIGG